MNFSGVYSDEGFLPEDSDVLDMTGLEGVECYCDGEAASRIREAIRPYEFRDIHWIDSGDYHYMSYFWLEKIDRPFALVLYDNHPDDQEPAFGADILSCGGWVAYSRRKLSNFTDLVPGIPVYLSIDKDILSTEYARTNWNQGEMTIPQLEHELTLLSRRHQILGIDVCGELTSSKGGHAEDFAVNLKTNLELARFLPSLLPPMK